VRHFSDGEPDEVRKCYAAFTNVIAGELNQMVRDLIYELRDPGKETQQEKVAAPLSQLCFDKLLCFWQKPENS
jgi:hypothetical protein